MQCCRMWIVVIIYSHWDVRGAKPQLQKLWFKLNEVSISVNHSNQLDCPIFILNFRFNLIYSFYLFYQLWIMTRPHNYYSNRAKIVYPRACLNSLWLENIAVVDKIDLSAFIQLSFFLNCGFPPLNWRIKFCDHISESIPFYRCGGTEGRREGLIFN